MAALPEYLQPLPAGREKLPREVREEHQRDRVLAAAAEVFAKRGYPGTTVDHIVAAAKIGVGSFYSLFEGKEDCFLQVYGQIVAATRERIVAAIPAEAPWRQQACAALRALLDAIEADPLRARIALVEVQTAGSTALARYEETMDSVIPLLGKGRDDSPVADEMPQRLEEAIVGGLAWFLQQRVVMGEFEGAEAHLPDVLEIVVEPYVGEQATAELLAAAAADSPLPS
jgi:AcrR family transcriptional regulator